MTSDIGTLVVTFIALWLLVNYRSIIVSYLHESNIFINSRTMKDFLSNTTSLIHYNHYVSDVEDVHYHAQYTSSTIWCE